MLQYSMELLNDTKVIRKPLDPKGKAAKKSGYRPTRQSRSAASEKKLIEAAEQLFARHGYTHTRISEIIRASGLSTGTFYHRFSDKEGLLDVMMRRFISDASALIDEWGRDAEQHETLQDMLTSLVGVIFDTITARLGVYRAMQEMAQDMPEQWHAFGGLGEQVVAQARCAIEIHRSEVSAADIETATINAVQVILLLVIQTRLGAGIMFPKNRKAFVPVVVQAAMGILQPGV